MEPKKLLEKYYSRLAQESFLKSLLWGLVVGFSALLLSAIVCWYVGFKGIWVCIVLFVAATAISTPLFYFCRFRPTIKQTARRVDSLGLEERLLTMTELEGDNSYIAVKQREDAVQALKKVNARLIKFVFSVSLVVTLAIVGVFGTGMTTYAALSEVSGRDLIRQALEGPAAQYEVIYQVKGDGRIIGEERQVVTAGEKAQPVMAVADSDWVFVGWDDGNGNPLRLDTEINDDMVVYAVFEEMDGVDYINIDDNAEIDGKGNQSGNNGNNNSPSDMLPPEGEDSNGPGGDQDGSGGRYEGNGQIIDGGQYYGDHYEAALEEAKQDLMNNENISEEDKQIIMDYFETIKK